MDGSPATPQARPAVDDLMRDLAPQSDLDDIDTIVDLSIRLRMIVNTLVEVARSADENLQELEVLTRLYRRGAPYRLHPGELVQQLGITSGALTGRMDNLERADYLRREQDPRDRRQTYVTLTSAGRERAIAARSRFNPADINRVRRAITADYR